MLSINSEPRTVETKTAPTRAVLPRWISNSVLRTAFALGVLTGTGAPIAEAAPVSSVAMTSCDVPPSSNSEKVYCPDLAGPLKGRLRMGAYWANPENPNDLMAGIDDRIIKVEINGHTFWAKTKKDNSDGTAFWVESPDKVVTGNEPTELPVDGDCSDRADFYNSQRRQWENACAEIFTHWRVSSTDPNRVLEGPFTGAVRECPEGQEVVSEEYQWRRNTPDQNMPRRSFREPLNRDSRVVQPSR